jgi:hypothetical protein
MPRKRKNDTLERVSKKVIIVFCQFCLRHAILQGRVEQKWDCPACSLENPAHELVCEFCDTPMPSHALNPQAPGPLPVKLVAEVTCPLILLLSAVRTNILLQAALSDKRGRDVHPVVVESEDNSVGLVPCLYHCLSSVSSLSLLSHLP